MAVNKQVRIASSNNPFVSFSVSTPPGDKRKQRVYVYFEDTQIASYADEDFVELATAVVKQIRADVEAV